MDNCAIADNFSLLAKLMDIHGENSFKTKTYAVAAFNIEKLPGQLKDSDSDKLFSIKGIGEKTQKNVQVAINFYLQHQESLLYAQVNEVYPQIKTYLEKIFLPSKVRVTGAFRRQELIINELEFVIQEKNELIKPKFQTA